MEFVRVHGNKENLVFVRQFLLSVDSLVYNSKTDKTFLFKNIRSNYVIKGEICTNFVLQIKWLWN